MSHPVFEAVPYIAGIATASLSILGQVTDISVWAQAGIAGITILLLLKVFPALMQHLEDKDQRHEATIQRICQIHDERNKEWQRIVQNRGICPVSSLREDGLHEPKQHHE